MGELLELLELQKYLLYNVWGFWSSKSIIFITFGASRAPKVLCFSTFGASGAPKVLFSKRLERLWSFTPGDRTKNSFIFRCRFANFALRDPLGGRSRRALHFENMQYRIGFINVFDALIDSMLDHRTFTKNQKTSATLHGNAPAKNGTSAALHGNAFRVFMVRLGASKSSPCDRTKHWFSNHFFDNCVLQDPLGGRSFGDFWAPPTTGRTHARTDGRTHGRTDGARPPSTTHTGKKYAVRGTPPHSDMKI